MYDSLHAALHTFSDIFLNQAVLIHTF